MKRLLIILTVVLLSGVAQVALADEVEVKVKVNRVWDYKDAIIRKVGVFTVAKIHERKFERTREIKTFTGSMDWAGIVAIRQEGKDKWIHGFFKKVVKRYPDGAIEKSFLITPVAIYTCPEGVLSGKDYMQFFDFDTTMQLENNLRRAECSVTYRAHGSVPYRPLARVLGKYEATKFIDIVDRQILPQIISGKYKNTINLTHNKE